MTYLLYLDQGRVSWHEPSRFVVVLVKTLRLQRRSCWYWSGYLKNVFVLLCHSNIQKYWAERSARNTLGWKLTWSMDCWIMADWLHGSVTTLNWICRCARHWQHCPFKGFPTVMILHHNSIKNVWIAFKKCQYNVTIQTVKIISPLKGIEIKRWIYFFVFLKAVL